MLNINTKAQLTNPSPDTILNNKSGSMNMLYKKEIPEVIVNIIYELIFALFFLCSHKSLIVGMYPMVAATPTLAYATIKICNNSSCMRDYSRSQLFKFA